MTAIYTGSVNGWEPCDPPRSGDQCVVSNEWVYARRGGHDQWVRFALPSSVDLDPRLKDGRLGGYWEQEPIRPGGWAVPTWKTTFSIATSAPLNCLTSKPYELSAHESRRQVAAGKDHQCGRVDGIRVPRNLSFRFAHMPLKTATLTTLNARIDELIAQHGTLRASARVLEVDPGYLSRLRYGEKNEPGETILRRMGLRRVVAYERTTQ